MEDTNLIHTHIFVCLCCFRLSIFIFLNVKTYDEIQMRLAESDNSRAYVSYGLLPCLSGLYA